MALRHLAGLLLLAVGCFRAPVPMTRLEYTANGPAKCLLVLMPGAGSNAGDFEAEGFIKKVLDSGLSLDVVAANATLGYYMRETMLPRVHEDVLTPLLANKQYQKRWIAGMSMGGFGSLFYAMNYPKDVDGVFAMAPWLGDRSLVDEIRDAGGLLQWPAPPAEPVNGKNYQRQLWRWLKQSAADPSTAPALWLGFGKQDSLAPMDQVLADALKPEQVLLTDGEHEWAPWNVLIERFLKEGPLAAECRP